jgi:hypothetical protein
MLTHAADGFLEVDDGKIDALWRSPAAVPIEGVAGETFEVQAFLVVHRQDAARAVHAAFYCRALKRAVVFAVAAVDGEDVTACGMAELTRLGFRLKEVNLNLNPALRQVVLRDIPVLRRTSAPDKLDKLAIEPISAATAIDLGDSDSAIAKRTAALKHQRERELDRKLQIVRAAIELRLQPGAKAVGGEPQPAANVDAPAAAAASQSVSLAMANPDRQSPAEVFLAAAERRIRELEGQLVEAESRVARLLEGKMQLSELEGRVAELTSALARAARQVEVEQQERQALTAAHALVAAETAEQLHAAAAQRVELETALTDANRRRGDAEAAQAELKKALRAARKRLKAQEGATAEPAADREVTGVRAQLAAATEERDQERLRAAELLRANHQQEQELAALRQRSELLTDRLQKAEQALDGGTPLSAARATLESALAAAQAATVAERQARDELADQLRGTTAQLAEERRANQRLERAHAEAEQRCASLAAELRKPAEETTPVATGNAGTAPAVAKPLPHQVRPAPRKGALFRPDWDMNGLPCRSADQVVQAWESVYNVQLSLEGYPSQYCAAFLVVIEADGRRQPYLLFSLKKSRHLLVCIPGQPPDDETTLLKLLDEAQKYLKKSGFELEKIAAADVPDTLGGYFSGG